MQTAGAAFAAAVICSSILTPVIRDGANRRGLLDHGLTSRKAHGRPVPRLGGIAIVAGFFAPMVLLMFVNSSVGRVFTADRSVVAGLFAGGLAIAALGLYDDLRGTGARTKFAVQFAVAGLAWAFGYRIDHVALPLLGTIDLGPFGLPLTLLWIAGVINAMNLIDGLDGLAGGVALIVVISLFCIAVGHGNALLMLFAAALAGAVLGFLFFNFNPASIFMGDTGSMFLGFVLAVVSIQTAEKSSTAVALLMPIVALGVPIADTLLSMTRRGLRGVPLFSADRGHIHHRLLAKGLSHRETALTLYGFTACLGGAAMVIAGPSDHEALLALAILAGGVVVVLRWLGFLDWQKFGEVCAARRRNLERRKQVAMIAGQLQRAADPAAMGAVLAAMLPALAVDHVALKTSGHAWAEGRRHGLKVTRYGLDPERPGDEVLEVGWTGDGAHVDRDTEIAIEHLCVHLRTALRRGEREGWAAAPAAVTTRLTHPRVGPHPEAVNTAAADASRRSRKIVNA